MNSKVIAQAVKDYLIKLAVDDKLPTDLTQLNVDELREVIEQVI